MKVLFKDLGLAFSSIGFWLAVIVTACAGVAGGFGFFQNLQKGLTDQGPPFLLVAYDLFYSDLFVYVLPIVTPLAYGASFVDEYQSRVWLYYMPRSGSFRIFKLSKIISTALSGGFSVIIGMVSSTLIFLVFSIGSTIQFAEGIFLGYLIHILLLFIGGCLWALVGGFFATLMNNQYVAYAGPFIFFYIGSIFQKRYFKNLFWLSPREWTFPIRGTLYQMIPIVLIMLGVSVGLYYFMIGRRLKNG